MTASTQTQELQETLEMLTWTRDCLKETASYSCDPEANRSTLSHLRGAVVCFKKFLAAVIKDGDLSDTSVETVYELTKDNILVIKKALTEDNKIVEALASDVLLDLLSVALPKLIKSLEVLVKEVEQLLNPQPQVEAEEVAEEVTLTPEQEAETFFSEISEKYENGLSSTQDYLKEGFDYFVEIKNDKIKRSLSKIEGTIHAIKGERFKYWRIEDRRGCTRTLINDADDLITYDFGESFADLLKAAKIECDIDAELDFDECYEYEENYDELCARIDTFVHEEFIDIDKYLIAQNIQDATSDIYDFDFVTRLSSEMAKDNFEPVGFIYDYCQKLNEMLEEFMDDLKRYLNLAIQEALKLQSRMQVKGE